MCANHRGSHGDAPRWRYVVAITLMLAAIVVAAGVAMDYLPGRDDTSPSPARPSPTTELAAPVGPIIPTPTKTSTASEQQPTKKVFLPDMVSTAQLGSRKVERLPRLVVGNGVQFPAPIDFNPSTYAWDESSAKPGSSRGVVILTAHAYSQDQTALGNRLTATLDSGSTIEISGEGKRLRYIVDARRTYDLASYSQLAGKWLDPDADAMLTLTVCDDYNPATGNWDSRIVWQATPLK